MSDDPDLEDLREQTRGTDRIENDSTDGAADDGDDVADTGGPDTAGSGDGDAATGTASTTGAASAATSAPAVDVEPPAGFADEVATAVGRARSGIDPGSYSGTDPALGGLFEVLRERPEDAERVAEALAAAAGEEPPETVDKATLVDLAVAAGLGSAAPGIREIVDEHR